MSATSPDPSEDRGVGPRGLGVALVVAGVLRLALLMLPAPGRDEATYVVWAREGHLAYAPLLGGVLALVTAIGTPGAWMPRLVVLGLGAATLALAHRVLLRAEVAPARRRALLAALALCPWQTYTGAIVHPDAVFVPLFLALALVLEDVARGSRRGRAGAGGSIALATLLSGVLVWAKPTGVLVIPLGVAGLLGARVSVQVGLTCGLGALGLASPVLVATNGAMVRELLSFGRLDPTHGIWTIAGVVLLALAFEGGPVLAGDGLRSLVGAVRRVVPRRRRPPMTDATRVALVLGGGLVVCFAVMLITNGQFKGNWVLPGLFLLAPFARPLWGARAAGIAVSSTGLASLAMVVLMTHPDLVASLETRLPGTAGTYRLAASTREARVSTTGGWSERFREYRPLDPFRDRLAATRPRGAAPPAWIVSDDYGLAAQLAWAWRASGTRIAIPTDGLFAGDAPARRTLVDQGAVFLAVHGPLARLWPGRFENPSESLPHPTTGAPIEVAWVLPPADRAGEPVPVSEGATR